MCLVLGLVGRWGFHTFFGFDRNGWMMDGRERRLPQQQLLKESF